MTFFPEIIVLEDTPERVAWLRETFPDVEIEHVVDVVAFLKATRKPHALTILDHDLGGPGLAYTPEQYDRGEANDAYGLNGLDACRMCDHRTPTVVWSANPVCGPRMYNALEERRVPVVYYPFRADANMAGVIQEAYFANTGVWLAQVYRGGAV